jgi:hypothetical protein
MFYPKEKRFRVFSTRGKQDYRYSEPALQVCRRPVSFQRRNEFILKINAS